MILETKGYLRWKQRYLFAAERTPLDAEPDLCKLAVEGKKLGYFGKFNSTGQNAIALRTAWIHGQRILTNEEKLDLYLTRLRLKRIAENEFLLAKRLSEPPQFPAGAVEWAGVEVPSTL